MRGGANSPEELERYEKEFNVRYLCVYPAAYLENLKKTSGYLFAYIQNNYSLKELGLLQGNKKPEVAYAIYERAGNRQDISEFIRKNSGKIKLAKIYNLLGKKVPFYKLRAAD